MKRAKCAVIITDQTGEVSQHSIHNTAKEAKQIARELALEKVRNGMQTELHTDKVFIFPDGYRISVRKVMEDISQF